MESSTVPRAERRLRRTHSASRRPDSVGNRTISRRLVAGRSRVTSPAASIRSHSLLAADAVAPSSPASPLRFSVPAWSMISSARSWAGGTDEPSSSTARSHASSSTARPISALPSPGLPSVGKAAAGHATSRPIGHPGRPASRKPLGKPPDRGAPAVTRASHDKPAAQIPPIPNAKLSEIASAATAVTGTRALPTPPRRGRAAAVAARATRRASDRRRRAVGAAPRAAGSGQRAAGSGQRAAGSGQRAAGSGQRAAGSGQRAAGSGQRAAGSRQRAAGSGQRAAGGD